MLYILLFVCVMCKACITVVCVFSILYFIFFFRFYLVTQLHIYTCPAGSDSALCQHSDTNVSD